VQSKRGRMMSGPRFDAIILDIGDTLIRTESIMRRCAGKAAVRVAVGHPPLNPNNLVDSFFLEDGKAEWPHINHFYSDIRIMESALANSEFAHKNLLRQIAAELLVSYRQELRSFIIPNKRVTDTLSSLRDESIRLGVISNGTLLEQIEILINMGVLEFFQAIVISEEVGFKKPSAEIFDVAVERLGLMSRADILYVGDNWQNDVIGATSAGLQAAHLQPDSKDFGRSICDGIEYYSIRSLSDLVLLSTEPGDAA